MTVRSKCPEAQEQRVGLGGSIQICIHPPALATYATLHRYPGVGGTMQICIDSPPAPDTYANLHRSQGLGRVDANPALGRSMQIFTDPPRA